MSGKDYFQNSKEAFGLWKPKQYLLILSTEDH